MKKTLTIVLIVSVGLFTACTTTTPDVPTAEVNDKVNTEEKSSSTLSNQVVDKAVTVAKGVAVSAATKKLKDMGSSKKKK